VEDIYMRYLHIQPKDIDRTSTTYLNRLHHCRLKNFENPVYTCDQCGCAFNGLAVFTKHMQNHALHRERKADKQSEKFGRRSLFYCPKCQLPYRAVVPYIKHLKKHLIAIIRVNGIREHGTGYDFDAESYDNTGSLQCPVTECRQIFLKEDEMIGHMEDHLSKLSDAEVRQASEDVLPARGRPSLFGEGIPDAFGGPRFYMPVDELCDTSLPAEDESGSVPTVPVDAAVAHEELFTADDDLGTEPLSNSDPLKCERCKRIFSKPSQTLQHQYAEHAMFITSCPLCFQRMDGTLALIDHVSRTHDDYRITRIMRDALKRKADAAKDLELKCDRCRMDFTHYKELLKHQHYVHGTTDKKCRLCSKVINSYPSLMGHVNACDGSMKH